MQPLLRVRDQGEILGPNPNPNPRVPHQSILTRKSKSISAKLAMIAPSCLHLPLQHRLRPLYNVVQAYDTQRRLSHTTQTAACLSLKPLWNVLVSLESLESLEKLDQTG
jgi:hypothetical protein